MLDTPFRTRLGRLFTIGSRKRSYVDWNKSGMLLDLAEFCRASETTYDENERLSLIFEGRRQVWLRIVQHLHLTDAQLLALFTGKPPQSLQD